MHSHTCAFTTCVTFKYLFEEIKHARINNWKSSFLLSWIFLPIRQALPTTASCVLHGTHGVQSDMFFCVRRSYADTVQTSGVAWGKSAAGKSSTGPALHLSSYQTRWGTHCTISVAMHPQHLWKQTKLWAFVSLWYQDNKSPTSSTRPC